MGARSARQPNSALGHWVRAANVSYAELARELHTTARIRGRPDLRPDRTRIGHWVTSGERPRPPMPDLLAETLGRLCGRPLCRADLGLADPRPEIPDRPASPPPPPGPAGDHTNRRQALAAFGAAALAPLLSPDHAAATANTYTRDTTATDLEPQEIPDLDLAVHQLGATYSNHSPADLWPLAVAHRHHASDLLHHRRHTLREGRDIARHAGMLSVVLAWIAHDLGRHDSVEAYAADARAHGRQADAPDVCAWAEDVLSTHALYDNRPLDALAAATRGIAIAPRDTNAAIRLTAQVARAHALLGNAEGFAEFAARAHAHQERLPLAGAGLFAVDAVRILSYDASSYVWLGRPVEARTAATEAVRHYEGNSAATSAPTRLAIARLDLALAHAALGEPDAALHSAHHALNGDRIVNATTGRARQLDHTLRRRYPTLTAVADFHERVRLLSPATS